jgi:hypothetical protein
VDDNIEQQYDEVIRYISAYRAYVLRINSRLLQLPIRKPRKYLSLLRETWSAWRETNLLSGKNIGFNRVAWSEIATNGEKSSKYFPILVSDYPLHELSLSLVAHFAGVDFEKLNKLHELKKNSLSRFRMKHTLGIVLGGATILLKSIPESVVSRLIDYRRFELVTFLIACAAIFYLLIVLLPFWWKFSQALTIHTYAEQVLEYTCIRQAKNDDQARTIDRELSVSSAQSVAS